MQVLGAHDGGKCAFAQLLGVDHEGVELSGGEAAVRAELEGKGDSRAAGGGGAQQDYVAGTTS